jgi:hypothetical protein
MDEMWVKITSTHPQTTRKYFDEFATNLWTGWVPEKKKTTNRLVSGTRRRGRQTREGGSRSHGVDTIMAISVPVKPVPASDWPQQKTPPPIAAQSDTDPSMSDTFHIDSDPTIISDPKMHTPQHSVSAHTLMSPPSIISKSNDSPSTSSSFTPHKRSFAESLKLPLPASLTTIVNPAVEEYLLCQLTKNVREGLITPQGVLRVL